MERNFREMLARRQKDVESLVCVGLDPLPQKLPKSLFSEPDTLWAPGHIELWMRAIIDATAPFASMFKPQRAHFEAFSGGAEVLQSLVRYIKKFHPDIPVFLDCKRGDIGRTQECYRFAHFEVDGVDGMNFNPYMGDDCMKGLVDPNYLGRALVGLCYTSNPSARQVQDVLLADGQRLWEFIAKCTLKWAEDFGVLDNAGLVMAAAYESKEDLGRIYTEHLIRCREIVGNKLWFLIPGVGAQGGFVEETIKAAYRGPGSIAINSSSEINFASSGKDFAEAAGLAAEKLRDATRAIAFG